MPLFSEINKEKNGKYGKTSFSVTVLIDVRIFGNVTGDEVSHHRSKDISSGG